MGLVMPDFGLLFWMVVSFSILLFILKKFAWKPILKALADRENSIDEALKAAQLAKDEMTRLQADNEKILREAIIEREQIVKEAREMKDSIVRDAKTQASVEANKVMENAKAAIEQEKTAAIGEIKDIISSFSIDIAEKILKEHLADEADQKKLVKKYVDQIEFIK
jgi:F-type H+-transporting ATPase subunit b